jgi:peptidoglycan hydrolase-like protein with peptidoglycan-binding domain
VQAWSALAAVNRGPDHAYPEKRNIGRTGQATAGQALVATDGEFGSNTEKALIAWQSKNALTPDGVAEPDTFMAMGLYELVLLKQGTRGDVVKKLQERLGVGADGQFVPGTEKAVRDYQQKNGLAPDGAAGPATLADMKLFKEITAETVKASQVPSVPGAATAAGAGLRSIWDTIKGVFK